MDAMQDVIDVANRLTYWRVTLPATVTDVLLVWKTVSERPSTRTLDNLRIAALHGELTADTAAQAIQDAALEMVAAEQAQRVAVDLAAPLAARAAAALRENGDDLVAALRVHWDRAVTKLTDAADVVPSGATAEQVIGQGDAAVRAWADLAAAAASLDILALARARLANLGYGSTARAAACLFLASSPSKQQLADAESILMARDPRTATERGGRWRLLLDAGHELRLNTAAEARDVEHMATKETARAGSHA